MDTSILRENIQSLVEKFERDKHHYLPWMPPARVETTRPPEVATAK